MNNLSDDNKFKLVTRMWASSCFIKTCYLALIVALILDGDTTLSHPRTILPILAVLMLAYMDAKYLQVERVPTNRRGKSVVNCYFSWSVLPFYIAVTTIWQAVEVM